MASKSVELASWRNWLTGAAVAGGFSLFGLVAPASAQTFICPNGPGPGEVQVGVTNGGTSGVAEMPICAPDSSDQQDDGPGLGPADTGPTFATSHMAVAWHPDTSEIWATTGRRTIEDAENTVLRACREAMGEGCAIGVSWTNSSLQMSYIAVVVDEFGQPWIKGAPAYQSRAESQAMELCESNSFGCHLVRVFEHRFLPLTMGDRDVSQNFFPVGTPKRSKVVVVAWPERDPGPPWQGRTWLISGRENYAQSKADALKKCQEASSVTCALGPAAPNGVLVRYTDDEGKFFWIGSATVAGAAARVATVCAAGHVCRVIELYDAATAREIVIDEAKSLAPVRGFFSIAWPSVASDWNKVAIVTGKASPAEAKAAAIELCQTQSKAKCEPFFDEDDYGTQQFIAVFSDSDGNTRIYSGYSAAGVEQRALASCAQASVTCSQKLVLDLARPVSITPGL